jgi:uncharacterized membrane protein YczE
MPHLYPQPWFTDLLVSLPQSYLVIILGFALFGLSITASKALSVAVIDALSSHIVHQFPLWFGIHTVIFIAVSVIFCLAVTRYNFVKIAAAILAGTIVVLLLQSIYVPLILLATQTTLSELPFRPWFMVISYTPEPIIMAILYYLAKKYDFQIFNRRAEIF